MREIESIRIGDKLVLKHTGMRCEVVHKANDLSGAITLKNDRGGYAQVDRRDMRGLYVRESDWHPER